MFHPLHRVLRSAPCSVARIRFRDQLDIYSMEEWRYEKRSVDGRLVVGGFFGGGFGKKCGQCWKIDGADPLPSDVPLGVDEVTDRQVFRYVECLGKTGFSNVFPTLKGGAQKQSAGLGKCQCRVFCVVSVSGKGVGSFSFWRRDGDA